MRSLSLVAGLLLTGSLRATVFSTGDLLQADPVRMGVEDVINVQVLKHPEFSGDFLIPPGGIVEFPGAGPVKVEGKTLAEVSQSLTSLLKRELNEPKVFTTLKVPRIRRVYTGGAVAKPGIHDLKPGWRISEILSAAGGLGNTNRSAQDAATQEADVVVQVIHAATGKRESYRLSEVLHGDAKNNIELQTGDFVNFEETPLTTVYVMGDVRAPGAYHLREDNGRLVEALATAGGFNPDAATSRVQVTHLDGQIETVNLSSVVLQGGKAPDIHLQNGDVVFVPVFTSKIAVLGLVKTPGIFPLVDGRKVDLAEALGYAQGQNTSRARLSKVAVIRLDANGKAIRRVYDFGSYLRKANQGGNPEIQAGDVIYVPETNSFDWSSTLGALTAVAVSINAAGTTGIIK